MEGPEPPQELQQVNILAYSLQYIFYYTWNLLEAEIYISIPVLHNTTVIYNAEVHVVALDKTLEVSYYSITKSTTASEKHYKLSLLFLVRFTCKESLEIHMTWKPKHLANINFLFFFYAFRSTDSYDIHRVCSMHALF